MGTRAAFRTGQLVRRRYAIKGKIRILDERERFLAFRLKDMKSLTNSGLPATELQRERLKTLLAQS